jgi:hypothetical protein
MRRCQSTTPDSGLNKSRKTILNQPVELFTADCRSLLLQGATIVLPRSFSKII